MYCINVKEQFDVRFMIKTPIFCRQGFNIFHAHSVIEGTYLLRVLAMKLKNDHRSKFPNLSNWKEEA